MSPRPICRSDDLRRLQAEGYTLDVIGGYIAVHDIPHVDGAGIVHRDGVLVMDLTLAGDATTKPSDHTASFGPRIPCDHNGHELTTIINGRGDRTVGEVQVACSMSMKPVPAGNYGDFYEKVTKYVAAIAGHATVLDSDTTAHVFRPVVTDGDDGPFRYLDTASARAGTDALNDKLRGERVGVVGLGGTGEYVLDFVAKTHVEIIHVFDGDRFLTHNAFRAPGAPTLEQLREAPYKVDHFAAIYGCMRDGIVTHPYAITDDNVEDLLNLTFVFVCIDDPAAKAPIIDALIAHGIDFVDVGMGIELVDGMLTGIVRTTLVTGQKHDHAADRISTAAGGAGGEYRSNIQIAELNARNASDAVIRWKKVRGVYADLGGEHFTAFTITTNSVINDDSDDGAGAALRCA